MVCFIVDIAVYLTLCNSKRQDHLSHLHDVGDVATKGDRVNCFAIH